MRSPFQDLEECGHFEWMDQYIRDRGLQVEVLAPNQAVQEEISNRGAPNRAAPPMEHLSQIVGHLQGVNVELQKLNKQLSQIVELKKQANMMAGAFVCIIAIYLMFMHR